MNLLVEKCDCTITATYKDAEGKQYGVNVLTATVKVLIRSSLLQKTAV